MGRDQKEGCTEHPSSPGLVVVGCLCLLQLKQVSEGTPEGNGVEGPLIADRGYSCLILPHYQA